MSLLRLLTIIGLACGTAYAAPDDARYDVVVYGGTSGGVIAAIQVHNMGKTAIVIEPGQHVGGLTSGGLGATDIGNKEAIGGLSRTFYQRVKTHYDDPDAWVQESNADYNNPRHTQGDDAMWTFEPHVAEDIYRAMLDEAGVPVVYGERLNRETGVTVQDGRIQSIRMESGLEFEGAYFIDATYEGDLMAAAGVSYHVGRESNDAYGETINGVQTKLAIHHQLAPGVDPYVEPGNADSGLLPGVHGDPPGEEGSGDKRVQAYCFRMCLTDHPENRTSFEKPAGYDPQRYELLLRNFEAGEDRVPWIHTPMPNRKTDMNNRYGFSTDNIGMNYAWPEADYATREQIFQEHLLYQRGLMWTLANHPRVPEGVRETVSEWGNCKDEFPEHDGWSHQLYIREARRMVSDYVMTQKNCEGFDIADDPVGLAAYTMDSHHVQRYVTEEGYAQNEGDVQIGGFPPYPISYRSIRPRKSECENLLVPVCLSASHMAFGSIRMEPVFMVLGQSAATAACLAVDAGTAVQDIDYDALRARLEADNQVLVWEGFQQFKLDPAKLDGIVVDDFDAELSGGWRASTTVPVFVGLRYWHDANELKGELRATYRPKEIPAGRYEVRVSYSRHGNRATNVPVTIRHADGTTTKRVNQRAETEFDDAFVSLGVYSFAENEAVVEYANEGTDGHMVIDAVQFIPVEN